MIKDPGKLFLCMRNSATVAHVLHLSAVGEGSFAKHKALNEYYDGIIEVADRFAEAYMGLNNGERIKFNTSSFKLEMDATKMLKGMRTEIEAAQAECSDSMIKQILDDAKELVCGTIYLLTLK
jgi:DNA-binding ferritin-like protein